MSISGLIGLARQYRDLSEHGGSASFEDFQNVLGEERFRRICSRQGIAPSDSITKAVARRILVESLLVRGVEDEIPKEYEELFLGQMPSLESFRVDKAKSSGRGDRGLMERAFLAAHHHFQPKDEIRDAEFLTSRMADRELQVGTVLSLSDGLFRVDRAFVGGGAYVVVLRDMRGQKAPKVVCRGTALRPTATSGLLSGVNDLLLHIGSMGVRSVWPSLSAYLKREGITSAEVLGKSLGGAHAQELSILMEGIQGVHVDRLTTVGSVGVGSTIHELFEREILSKRSKEDLFRIRALRNGGANFDHIPMVGGVHLGGSRGCQVEALYLHSKEEGAGSPSSSFWGALFFFFQSFGKQHVLQSTVDDYEATPVKEVNDFLSLGERLDTLRWLIAGVLDLLTLGFLNETLFDGYYLEQKYPNHPAPYMAWMRDGYQ